MSLRTYVREYEASEEAEISEESDGNGSVIVPSDELEDGVDEVDETEEDSELKDSEEIDTPDTGVEVDLEPETTDDEDVDETDEDVEEESSLSSGDVIYGGNDEEDSEDDVDEEEEEDSDEAESMTIDGTEYRKEKGNDFWVSEDGEDFVFPPGKDESDYDLEEYRDDTSQDQDENCGQSSGEEQASLKQQ